MYFILTMNASHSGIISVLFYLPLSFCTYLFFFMLFLISKFIFSMILVDLLPWCVRFDGHSSLNWWLLANQRKYLWMGLSKCSSRAEQMFVASRAGLCLALSGGRQVRMYSLCSRDINGNYGNFDASGLRKKKIATRSLPKSNLIFVSQLCIFPPNFIKFGLIVFA